MSQKIVIKTSVNRPQVRSQTVSYQWHWRRICMATGMLVLAISATTYGLVNSVNADEVQQIDVLQAKTNVSVKLDDSQVAAEPADLLPHTEIASSTLDESLHQETLIEAATPVTALEHDTSANFIDNTPLSNTSIHQGEANEAINIDSVKVDFVQTASVETTDVNENNSEPLSNEAIDSRASSVSDVETSSSEVVDTTKSSHVDHAQIEKVPSSQSTQFSDHAQVTSVAVGAKIDMKHISRAVLTTAIEEREPVDVIKESIEQLQFKEKLFFFTEVRKLQGQVISHLWFHQDQLMAEIPLNIGANRFRTFSSKNIMPSQTGQWRVEAVTEQGELLAQKTFRIIPSAL